MRGGRLVREERFVAAVGFEAAVGVEDDFGFGGGGDLAAAVADDFGPTGEGDAAVFGVVDGAFAVADVSTGGAGYDHFDGDIADADGGAKAFPGFAVLLHADFDAVAFEFETVVFHGGVAAEDERAGFKVEVDFVFGGDVDVAEPHVIG